MIFSVDSMETLLELACADRREDFDFIASAQGLPRDFLDVLWQSCRALRLDARTPR